MRVTCPETAFYRGIIDGLNQINSPGTLRKNGFSLSDYYALRDVLDQVITQGESETCLENVAAWCNRHGMEVSATYTGWKIKIPENEQLATA